MNDFTEATNAHVSAKYSLFSVFCLFSYDVTV